MNIFYINFPINGLPAYVYLCTFLVLFIFNWTKFHKYPLLYPFSDVFVHFTFFITLFCVSFIFLILL
ncbi:hypothetical protein HMPREF3033_00743 [Veillonellaceae bacterium DNF00751]|nr:hypothetical protein HMPREF3033_00743 [Veillonellaceae bacterium DNF00751]